MLSNPSRFDKLELLSSGGGARIFKQECLQPLGWNAMSCELRTRDDTSPLLPGTRGLLLLGKDAFSDWTGNHINSLGEVRGSVYDVRGLPAIASFFPQDCEDRADWEGKYNPVHNEKDYDEDFGTEKAKTDAVAEKRRHGVTSRSNWKFWLQSDVAKLVRIVEGGGIPKRPVEPNYILHPNIPDVVERLLNTRENEDIYIDIETDQNLQITCCGIGFSDGCVFVVPFVDAISYRRSYPDLSRLLWALAVAAHRGACLVAHNGAAFDFFVLAWKYKMPIGWNVYDTMLAQHRIYPEVEKSLGHCTSLWTYEPFHKDESFFGFRSPEQLTQLMRYCGKDVFTMMLIKRAQLEYATRHPGLTESIAQVNASVRPYLTMTLQGIHFKQELRATVMSENDRLMTQYIRFINILVGGEVTRELNKKTKASLAASNAKATAYFHGMLGYPVIGTSKKTGKPSLGKKNMFRLRLKHNNPVIDVVMAYRETARESGSLKFTEWKDANGNTGTAIE